MQKGEHGLPEVLSLQELECSGNSVSEPVVENIAGCCEITVREVQPQPWPKSDAIACLGTGESDPTVSRSTALEIFKDRAQMQAQAKVDVDEKTPCATQIRDVLDVLLWACVILLVFAMVAVFYQLTVHGHAQRLLFAVRV